ncbi:hypothetical protein HOLleu_15419 [Holothuria leucospilota]|uniref:Uncharacterized protein n=1 Tax=Holothuria leucospilota TaxID=206669 RepID=A0A9Q1C9R1_HOLLE|nr:hypothetical protein HOLleu_15419 [Holothuria leucospilota]
MKAEPALPERDSNLKLARFAFRYFFSTEVSNIRLGFHTQTDQEIVKYEESGKLISSLKEVKPTCVDEVLAAISGCSNSTCDLNPILSSLLKKCDVQLAPVFTEKVNSSFATSIFPSSLKTAIVKPLLEEASLDKEIMDNCLPVSYLPFLSKVIEKIATSRINGHLMENNLHEKMQ